MGGACTEIDYFPNATVAEYGMIDMDDTVVEKIMTEMCVWCFALSLPQTHRWTQRHSLVYSTFCALSLCFAALCAALLLVRDS
jgi:hypothetical protein